MHLDMESTESIGEVSWRTIEHAGSVVGLVIVADQPETARTTDRPAPRHRPERDRTPL